MRNTSKLPHLGACALALALGTIASLAGCDRQQDNVTSPALRGEKQISKAQVHGSKIRRPDEDYFVGLGQEEPSFAGLFIDREDGDQVGVRR